MARTGLQWWIASSHSLVDGKIGDTPLFGGNRDEHTLGLLIRVVCRFFASFAVLISSLGALEGRDMVVDLWIVLYFWASTYIFFVCLGWTTKGNEVVSRSMRHSCKGAIFDSLP